MTGVVLRNDGTILVRDVCLLYPHLDQAWGRNPEDVKKFSCIGLLPKDRAQDAKTLMTAINQLLRDNKIGKLPSDKLFLRDGDDTGREAAVGMYWLSASESVRPKCIDGRKKVLGPEEIADLFYSGCWVNLLINPWFQNNKWGKRVNANLLAVQFVRNGEPISTRPDVDTDEVFDSIEEEFGGDDDAFDDPPEPPQRAAPQQRQAAPAKRQPQPAYQDDYADGEEDDTPF